MSDYWEDPWLGGDGDCAYDVKTPNGRYLSGRIWVCDEHRREGCPECAGKDPKR